MRSGQALSRRHFLLLSATTMTAAIAAACGGTAATPGSTAPAATSAAAASPSSGNAAASAAASKSGSSAANTAGNQSLMILQTIVPDSFDPYALPAGPSVNVTQQFQEGLVDRSTKPLLAKSWKNSDDHTWEFELQPNVKFHNGEAFNADAVKFSFDWYLSAKDTGTTRGLLLPVIDKVEVISPTSVRITTKQPFSSLLDILVEVWMLPPVATPKPGFGKAAVGTGPYKLKELVPADHVTLDANPDYWGGAPHVKQVTFRGVTEAAVRITELRAGSADVVTSVPPELLSQLNANGLTKFQRRGVQVTRVQLKCDSPQFKDVRVRQAANYAIDKEGILKGVLLGNGYVVNGQEAADMFGYNDSLKPYPYDPEKAKSLLKEAGVGPIEAQFQMPSGRFLKDKEVGQAIVDQLGKVGINAKANYMEFATWLKVYNKEGQGYLVQGQDSYPHRLFSFTVSSKVKSPQWYGYTSPKVDDLIDQAAATFDNTKRQDLYKQIDQITHDDPPWIYLFGNQDNYGLKSTVKGFSPTFDGYMYVKNMSLG